MTDNKLKTIRIEAVKGLMDTSVDIPNHPERSKLPMLDWAITDASSFFSKFGYESEYSRKLLDQATGLAASSDPVDRGRILNSLSENTGIKLQTLKGQLKAGQQHAFEKRAAELDFSFETMVMQIPHYLSAKDIEGAPFHIGTGDRIDINQMFFVRKFTLDHKTIYEPSEDRFYIYDEASGLWIPMSQNALKTMFSKDFHALVATHPLADKLLALRGEGFIGACVRLLKGLAEKLNAFARPSGKYILHLKNGMIVFEPDGNMIYPDFGPEHMSRNMISIDYKPGADCPRFLEELLGPYLANEDIELIQKYFGCILLGGNPIQCFLILSGNAGTGKGTLCEVLELIIGQGNVAELRTSQLSERFEIAAYAGKLLLAGKDVPGDFLQNKSAGVIKKLVGHDRIDGESKGINERTSLRGQYPIIINCNSRLRVHLDEDIDAWRRRLLIIDYSKPAVTKPIPNFASQLFAEEREGILNWGIKGAVKLLKDIQAYGKIQRTATQASRVDALLLESDSVKIFVTKQVCRGTGDLTSAELVAAYVTYCNEQGWNALPTRIVENQLPDIMINELSVQRVNNVMRNGKAQRGYHGVTFKAAVGGPTP